MASFIDYLWSGPSCASYQDWDAQRSYVLKTSLMPKASLGETISLEPTDSAIETLPEDRKFGYWIVDGFIKVKGNKQTERDERQEFWTNRQILNICIGAVSTLVGIVGLVAAFSVSYPLFILLNSVITLASLFFAGLNFYRAYQAYCQAWEWSQHPAELAKNLRQSAFEEGFAFVYKNRLKANATFTQSGVLHPLEVEGLYKKYFEEWNEKMSVAMESGDAERVQFLADFVVDNPLEPAIIKYALADGSLLTSFSEEFKLFRVKISSIKNDIIKQKREIAFEKSRRMGEINAEMDRELGPANAMLADQKARALEEKRQKLDLLSPNERINPNNPETMAIELEFAKNIMEYEMLYKSSAAPLRRPFEERIEAVNEWFEAAIAEIDEENESAMLPYFEAACQLFSQAYEVFIKGEIDPPEYDQPGMALDSTPA